MQWALPIGAALLAFNAAPSDHQNEATFARETLGFTSFAIGRADLNGDGVPELLILARDRDVCGSGGCTLVVATPKHGRHRIVSRLTVVRAPVRVLDTATLGWRDLAVDVSGGGLSGRRTMRLRYDGVRYPANPTVPPAEPIARPGGRIVIPR